MSVTRERRREIEQKWRENNRERDAELKRAWLLKNKHKRKAHRAVEYARKVGWLTKLPCHVCKNPNTHAHHDDYDRPLDVIWLCPQCHKDRHKMLKEARI